VSALHVLFKVDGTDYVVAASDVLQMETFTGATRVPGTPAHVAGLMQIRGRVVPVVDLRARFGLPSAEPVLDTRVVVVKQGERVVGLLVDSAREVLSIAPEAFRPPPEVVAEQASGFVKAVAQAGGRLVMLIDCDRVVGEEKLHGKERHPES
jgi:purine-binding chemotaxis protein CheW